MRKASKVSKKVMEFVTKKAAEWNVPVPDNAEDILRDIQEQSDRRSAPLRFVTLYLMSDFRFGEYLNANAATCIRHYIAISSKWAAFIVLKNNDKVSEAFKATVGHETGHAMKFIWPFMRFPHIKFTAWLNEVYADFYARKEFLDGDTNAQIRAMRFKQTHKINELKKQGQTEDKVNKNGADHPSWETRIRYIENFVTFDENLIRQIAEDTGCRSEKAIKKAIRFYL